ncbi:MAG TPA: glycosyltransferase [Vicinamibacterales bacterium]|nr:glycosyltransferase [Vicinamibacterales bacterium]HOQ60015.1 glycosyltransferase [Vicinamibacterales bacterium]HPK70405.1 glycosyltransferase [Vicinamibacterales bacterium]
MNPRILIAVHGYPPAAGGGAELRAARTAALLARRGLEMRAFAFGSHAAGPLRWDDADEDGVIVRRLNGDPAAGQDPFEASYDSQEIGRALQLALREWRPHLVYLFSGYLMSSSVVRAAHEAGIPVAVNLTDYWWFCHRINLMLGGGSPCPAPSLAGCARCLAESRRRWRLPAAVWPAAARAFWAAAPRARVLDRPLGIDRIRRRAEVLSQTIREVRALISPSRHLADFYARQGIDPGRLHVIRQGVRIEQRVPRVAAAEMRFVFAGQVKAHKGIQTLLDAWSMLTGPRPRRLTIYGSAAGEEAFGARIRKRVADADGVEWPGVYAPGGVWQVLAEADAVVVPSLCLENSPNIVLEAQATGVPVVGSNHGGVAELVRHDHDGLLFPAGSAVGLARALQRLLDEPGLAPRLSRDGPPPRSTEAEVDETLRVLGRFLPG